MKTEVHYLYRDASNYKFWGSFIVSGAFSTAKIERYLIDGEFFVPKAIGLPPLVPDVRNEDDHDWHTFQECVETSEGEPLLTARELIRRIKAASARDWPVG
ncbi:MAG: hypothetical protein M9883_16430 [Methylobacteriaceae bacterium]|nr:hypothetical protein [Methylobacteriaceae bacterium]